MQKTNWSIYDTLPDSPSYSIFINILRTIDKSAKYIFSLIFPKIYKTYKLPIGGDIYNLCDLGLFKFVLNAHKLNKDSPYVKFRFVSTHVILITSTQMSKKILTKYEMIRGKSYDNLVHFFGYGIFTSRINNRWKKQRQTLLSLFQWRNIMASSEQIFNITKLEIMHRINTDVNVNIDMVLLLSQIGLIIFCESILEIDVRDIMHIIPDPINELLTYINGAMEPVRIPFGKNYKTFCKNRNIVHNWMKEIIARMDKNNTNKITDYIYNHAENESERIELLISVILGGHETTSRLMLGILYSILNNKEILEKLRKELDNYFNVFNHTFIIYNDIHTHLPYLKNIIYEGLRLFPPVWILSREPINDIIVDDLIIKKGTQILLSPLIIQRLYSQWGEDAEIFKPERFEKSVDMNNFFPFVLGKYSCAGKNFALFESIIVIACIVYYFDIEIIEKEIRPFSAGTFRLSDNMLINIKLRNIIKNI